MDDDGDGRSMPHTPRRTLLPALLFSLGLVIAGLATSAEAEDDSFIDGLAAFDGGDLDGTIRIWSVLAADGNAQAQVGLAGLYLAGNGVRRDLGEAARLYRLAAEQGDSNGQLNLGRLYLDGVGVEQDLGLAYGWLTLAARQGRRWAKERSEALEPRLSDADRAKAEPLITNIEGH